MTEGIIVKGIGGFYYVKTKADTYTCKAKGSFRKENKTPYVGDKVEIRIVNEETKEGFIEEIKERTNFLIRPPVSNIDRMIIISAVAEPEPDTVFIDKMIAICEHNNIEPVLCFNKIDLKADLSIISDYEKIGYKVMKTSVKDGVGLCELKNMLINGITSVAGFSGVGKSSLLSTAINKQLETGKVSDKISRGKHTTRHVELFEVEEGKFFADTPGFSSLDFENIEIILKENLQFCFPEFEKYIGQCKFVSCAHIGEKGCRICEAVKNGEIPESRHESYKMMYDEVKDYKEWEH